MAVKHSSSSDGTLSAAGVAAWAANHTIDAGTITEAMQVLADNTTGDVSTAQHGYAPKAPNDITKFLRGDATWAVPTWTVASDDAIAYAINGRKSRGTVAIPTVITSGDDLLTISGFGYLGVTNTYQEATRITHDSTGTISDATNGIGGIIRFLTRKQGTDTAVVERFRVDDAGHLLSIAGTANTPTITAGGGTNPTITGTDNAFAVTIGTGGVASSVEVTFATAFANAPISSAQSDTDILALKSTALTTKVTITASTPFTAGSNIDCICMGRA